jgi:hypothetical protein
LFHHIRARAQACRVQNHDWRAADNQALFQRVARCAGDVGRDGAFLAQQRVQQRRLADIRATDDSDFDGLVGGFLVRWGRRLRLEVFEGALQHFSDVMPVNR